MLEYRGKASDFGAFLERNVNRVGYLIGTRGQKCTQAMIDSRLASTAYKPYWDNIRDYAAQWLGKVVADCEGIYDMFMNGGEWDKPLTTFKYADTNTDGQYKLAVSEGLLYGDISTMPKNEPYPIAVHMPGHVGFFYKGIVYQSIGHRRGFITTTLGELVNGKTWARWYCIPYLDYSDGASGGGEMVTLKYGETSTAVNDLQKKLMTAYGKLVGDDGTVYLPGQETNYYGTATKNGVLAVLQEYGLPGDGKTFDEIASAALTFKLAGIMPSTGITQEMLDAEKAKVATLSDQVVDLDKQLAQAVRDFIVLQAKADIDADKLAELKAMKAREAAILS